MCDGICLAPAARHKGKPFKQMHVLFVFQQSAVQFWQGIGTVTFQVLGSQIFGQQQLEPIQHFGGGRFFLQPGCVADLIELGQRGGQKWSLMPG